MQDLIEKFLNRTISVSERKRLKKWVLSNKENLNTFKKEINNRSENNLQHHFDGKDAFKEFMVAVDKGRTKRRKKLHFVRYAALFIGILATASFIYVAQFNNNDNSESTHVSNLSNQIVITLADGTQQVIAMDDTKVLTDKKGNIIAEKESAGLDFSKIENSSGANLVFNEVYIPYGQKFKITLSDGTKVWLNSGSSLRFPKNLGTSAQNRMVYLEGEAFFDVTKDKKRPFIVNAENLDIKVLGTQFNVSAYKSDGNISTTLVEGSVNVYENSNPDTKILLSPSYQAAFIKENGTLTKQKVDVRTYTSWMENRLIIDNLSFEQILRKLERAHNVSIINNAESLNNEMFKGEFQNERIETILNTIASSTPFTYEIENNVITISK
ncbi:hypothetical protein DKG77_06570 [Flagellimonas aquimarina]|uniref:FecR family protein n=1 Tax=Flagellimonas aquimarina TaxID=2201895 RepID=A0A316L4Y6_9FLAO|nr:FecR domain-containing protein [Allomuricauda koreensis]PWL40468.1 hypothetical protein DKG77_06570 [Allomuricauda koreensis]